MKKSLVLLAALAFCMIASQNALAQSSLGLKAIGGEIGLVSPENSDATAGFGVFANLGTMAPRFRLTSYLDYWSKSQDTFGGGSASVSDVVIGARGTYEFPVNSPKVQPFAGAGLGIHMLSAKVEMPGFPDVTDSQTKLGLDIGGGLEAPMGPKTSLMTEAWYSIVSDVSQFALKVGLSYKVGS